MSLTISLTSEQLHLPGVQLLPLLGLDRISPHWHDCDEHGIHTVSGLRHHCVASDYNHCILIWGNELLYACCSNFEPDNKQETKTRPVKSDGTQRMVNNLLGSLDL